MGVYIYPTHNIDRVANNGVKLTSTYVSYTLCVKGREGLMTGEYQDRLVLEEIRY